MRFPASVPSEMNNVLLQEDGWHIKTITDKRVGVFSRRSADRDHDGQHYVVNFKQLFEEADIEVME